MERTTVRLPPAPPAAYLRWTARCRELERAMREHPAVASFAAGEGAPFLRDAVADFVSGVLATEILRQAGVASRLGAGLIAPVLEVPSPLVARVAALVRRQVAWLAEADADRALGVGRLDHRAAGLSAALIEALEHAAGVFSTA
jgi:hypothetical protein